MLVAGLYLVRNEIDIIETNLRHHFSDLVDFALIVDNGSTDGTTEVLARLSRELPISWRSDPGPYRQSEITTELAREAARLGADWLLPIDADEFWCGVGSSGREVLEASTAGVLKVPIVNFVQARHVTGGGPTLSTMTMRPGTPIGPPEMCRELVESGKIAFVEMMYEPKCITRAAASVEIKAGNHSVEGAVGEFERADGLVCLHAPLRSRLALQAKIEQGARVSEGGFHPDEAWHVRRWHAMAASAGALDEEWANNSHLDGALGRTSARGQLITDERLVAAAQAVRDRLTPEAYIASFDTVPGWVELLDFRLLVELNRLQRAHGIRGKLLEIGADSGRTAILLRALARTSEDLAFGETILSLPSGTTDATHLAGRFRFVHIGGSQDVASHRQDIRTAERLLGPGGVVVVDGSARAAADDVLGKRLIPLARTDAKLYATWDPDLASWTGDLEASALAAGDVAREVHVIAGHPVPTFHPKSPTPRWRAVVKALAPPVSIDLYRRAHHWNQRRSRR